MLVRLCALGFATVAGFAMPAHAWRQELPAGRAVAVVVDGGGDVVSTGFVAGAPPTTDLVVVKHDGATGAELWRYTADGTGTGSDFYTDPDDDRGSAVAVDPMGDVIVVGQIYNLGNISDFAVVKLAGATGAQLWRVEIDGTLGGIADHDAAVGVGVDAAGNVIAAGHLSNTGTQEDLLVVKLAAATGAELWRVEEDDGGFENGNTVALDGAGNVVVGGTMGATGSILKLDGATGGELWRSAGGMEALVVRIMAGGDVAGSLRQSPSVLPRVVRLSGTSGTEVWRNDLPGGFRAAPGLALTAGGDVVVGSGAINTGLSGADLCVVKLAGASGAELWRANVDGTAGDGSGDYALSVAVDGAGDVVAAGVLANRSKRPADFAVVKLLGASGAEVWRSSISEDSNDEQATAVTIDGAGNPVAAGNVGIQRFTVVRLAAADGGVGPIRGKKLFVRDEAGNPGGRKIVARLEDIALALPPPGSIGDPTVAGATLRLVNPTTAETGSLSLPAALWSGLGIPAGSRGWEYRDSGSMGPCRRVLLRPGHVTLTCAGQLGTIPYTLDEPSQGSLTLSLEMGTTEPQCATFGGVITDSGTASPGPAGVFRARNAPAIPGDCP